MVTIKLDAPSARTRRDGPATAGIWLEIEGRGFPLPGWNDFAVVVLGWWCAAAVRLLTGESACETVHFMDGPYAVELTRPLPHVLRFRTLEGMSRSDEVAVGEERAVPFGRALLNVSRTMLGICREQEWWSADAQTLTDSSDALELALSRVTR